VENVKVCTKQNAEQDYPNCFGGVEAEQHQRRTRRLLRGARVLQSGEDPLLVIGNFVVFMDDTLVLGHNEVVLFLPDGHFAPAIGFLHVEQQVGQNVSTYQLKEHLCLVAIRAETRKRFLPYHLIEPSLFQHVGDVSLLFPGSVDDGELFVIVTPDQRCVVDEPAGEYLALILSGGLVNRLEAPGRRRGFKRIVREAWQPRSDELPPLLDRESVDVDNGRYRVEKGGKVSREIKLDVSAAHVNGRDGKRRAGPLELQFLGRQRHDFFAALRRLQQENRTGREQSGQHQAWDEPLRVVAPQDELAGELARALVARHLFLPAEDSCQWLSVHAVLFRLVAGILAVEGAQDLPDQPVTDDIIAPQVYKTEPLHIPQDSLCGE
jgi:hypothetical protein